MNDPAKREKRKITAEKRGGIKRGGLHTESGVELQKRARAARRRGIKHLAVVRGKISQLRSRAKGKEIDSACIGAF